MLREDLYLELYDKLWWQPDNIISGSFAVLSEYDYIMSQKDPNYNRLANNANRDELVNNFSDDNIYIMVDVILRHRQQTKSLAEKTIQKQIFKSVKLSSTTRRARSDNEEYLVKQFILDKEQIINNLLLHQDVLYNPVLIYNSDLLQCESILKFTLGFMDRHKFLSPKRIWNSRNISWCLVDIDMLMQWWHPIVTRDDIIDVDLRHYTTTVWLLIQQNQFNLLQQ